MDREGNEKEKEKAEDEDEDEEEEEEDPFTMQQRLIKERERHAWRLQNLIDAVNYCRQGWLKNPATGKIVAVNTLDGQKVLRRQPSIRFLLRPSPIALLGEGEG